MDLNRVDEIEKLMNELDMELSQNISDGKDMIELDEKGNYKFGYTDLIQEQTVLRIRQKGNNYKLTKKTRALVGADETHIFLSKEKALEMLENGFNANIIGVPHHVTKVAE